MKRLICTAFVFSFFPLMVLAARPLSTDDAGTVDKGAFEVEYGIEYINGTDNETGLCLVVKRGLFSNMDVGVEVPYTFIDSKSASDSDGFSDISISTKLNLLRDKEVIPDVSLGFAYKTESGNDSRNLGSGKPECSLNGIFSKAFESFAVHFNAGYSFKKDFNNEDNEDVLTYGLAFEHALGERANFLAEITGETALARQFNDNSCSALWGVNYLLKDNVTLDFGIGTEISKADPDFKVTSGITVGF